MEGFELRSKVAQLMAVAPALPIRDLYHLIIDSKGQFSKAKKRAIRMIEAPERHHPLWPPHPNSRQHTFSSNTDDLMVKIDPNDPAFEWDEDEPAPEPISAGRSHASRSAPNSKRSKNIDARNTTTPKNRSKQTAKTCSNTGVKRTNSGPANPTHARATSSDRDFVVTDNVVHYLLDSDDTVTSGDVSDVPRRSRKVRDTVMLDIDMHPYYAYNRDILKGARRS